MAKGNAPEEGQATYDTARMPNVRRGRLKGFYQLQPAPPKPKKRASPIHPKAMAKKEIKELEKDVFAYIWFAFIIALVIMTVFLKAYVKEMIIVSVLFMIFWYIEPIMFGMTGKTVTTLLSKGRKVADWKRFPLFFLVILLVYVLYQGTKIVLDLAFPEEHINIVFVVMWLGFLFLLWVYKFSKESK